MNSTLPSFETLRKMALENPDALERLRQQHVKAAIESAPAAYRQRLEGLQFQIDAQRRLAKTPVASCLTISKMMHDSLHQLKSFIDEGNMNTSEPAPATVLRFPRQAF